VHSGSRRNEAEKWGNGKDGNQEKKQDQSIVIYGSCLSSWSSAFFRSLAS